MRHGEMRDEMTVRWSICPGTRWCAR